MRRKALIFVGPGKVEVIDESCPVPGPGEVLVATRASALSAGTELLAYRGQLPIDAPLDETLPALADDSTRFPFRYGYASFGVVEQVGPGVEPSWRGRRVFAFVPHASAFVAPLAEVFAVPDDVPDQLAPLLASAETAVNLVLDARPLLGERVVVLGQGVVGLLVTAQLESFPLASLVAIEPNPRRAALAERLGAGPVCADAAGARAALGPQGADLGFELSGNPAALDAAIGLTGREGRIVVGSFYGAKRAPIDLGAHFHRGRLTLISSQVSHIAPALRGRWDRARRMAAAWWLLAKLAAAPDLVQALVSHRLKLTEAPSGYRLLDSGDPGALQILLVHE